MVVAVLFFRKFEDGKINLISILENSNVMGISSFRPRLFAINALNVLSLPPETCNRTDKQ